MKLRSINRYSVGSLIAIAALLAVVVTWGLSSLQATYTFAQDYQQLKNRVQVDVQRTIDDYLVSGDSTKLLESERMIEQLLSSELHILPAPIVAQVAPLAEELGAVLSGEMRAAGKLSGNPMALMIQNETEFRAALDSLSDYASRGVDEGKEPQATSYLKLVGELSRGAHALTQARQRYGDERSEALRQNVLKQLDLNSALIGQLKALPELGQYVEAEADDMADLLWGDSEEEVEKEVEKEELGQLAISELNSLANRYPAELERTEALLKRVESARDQVRARLSELQNAVASAEGEVESHRQGIFLNVGVALATGLLILLSIALFLYWLQRTNARGIETTADYLAQLAQGDYRQKLEFDSRVEEMSSLAESANLLQSSVSKILLELRRQSSELYNASESVSSNATEVSQLNSAQQRDTQQVIEAIDGVVHAALQIANSTESVSDVVDSAGEMIGDGSTKVGGAVANIESLCGEIERTERALEGLRGHADGIGNFVNVIQGIAEQTNLLALNAAIEAARAGEQGRGFAVVADEVRTLAGKTNDATREIQTLIETVLASSASLSTAMYQQQRTMRTTSTAVQEAGKLYSELVGRVDEVRHAMAMIAEEAQTQSAGSHQVQQFVKTASSNAETASQRSGGMLEISQSLVGISQQFESTASAFRLN